MLQFILTSAAPLERYNAEKAVEMFLLKRLTLFRVQSQYTGSVSENVGEGGRSVCVCVRCYFSYFQVITVTLHSTLHRITVYCIICITLTCIKLH